MFDIFSDIFACRENVFTRIDPRVKMVPAIALILSVVLSSKVYFPLTVLAFCLSAMLMVGMPIRLALLRIAGPMGIVAVLVVLQAFLSGSTPLFTLDFLSWKLTATEEGLRRGILIGSRVLGAVSVMLLFSSVTPAYKIFNALRWFRVPEGWVEIALLVYRYTFSLLDQTSDVITAQSTRLGYSSVGKSLSSMGVLAGTVITRSMDQAMRTYEAMTLRGYEGSMHFAPLPGLKATDIRNLAIVLPLILTVFMLMERYA
ncbi:MAG: cobalt ECF transporter T component CbiQ [Desulfomonile tiedjei]|uniref:Cobalt ECF transporter T component CbiQ n=1 Tax=Desulfomonile tiedjei TaxID=2358 RepID=A0A9D6V1L9_9BACT|nr:cobalt ECF transporter T component CbiQ [Desulfomonile tiedjei]